MLHSAFMLCLVKLLLKGEAGVCALKSHGNYIVDHEKSWKNQEIVFLNFCGNPALSSAFYPRCLYGTGSTKKTVLACLKNVDWDIKHQLTRPPIHLLHTGFAQA